ncbi:peptidoglycan-binding protein [Frankia sp. CN7]|nr:peptidoglycan-binding protein [Frankia nepalensis]MBL7511526.1 peptidoglycan-binding protein [Frankia nepalensis]
MAAGGAAATAAALGIADDGEAAGSNAGALPPSTAEVTRQTLTDSRTVDGDLGHGPSTTAVSRLPGTVTALPDTGAEITRGQQLFRVDDQSVTLMYGAMPAYRPLGPGTEGPDVQQLEENLAALGYAGFTVDDTYTGDTADAVARWQEDLGLPGTGRVDLGRVVFAADAVRVDSVTAELGDPVGPGSAVLSYTGIAKAVTVELETSEQRLATAGAEVTVTLPDGATTRGRIDEVSTRIVPGTGPEAQPTTTVEVVVGLPEQRAADAYTLASVDVTFTAAQRPDVLTVPVAALLALAEGGFGVEVVDEAAGTSRYVAVTTGLFADGRVEISGPGIAEGVTVGMPA